jgi:hypothetical protein
LGRVECRVRIKYDLSEGLRSKQVHNSALFQKSSTPLYIEKSRSGEVLSNDRDIFYSINHSPPHLPTLPGLSALENANYQMQVQMTNVTIDEERHLKRRDDLPEK